MGKGGADAFSSRGEERRGEETGGEGDGVVVAVDFFRASEGRLRGCWGSALCGGFGFWMG